MLRQVNGQDPDGVIPVIRLLDAFLCQGHTCLVFEQLQARPLALPAACAANAGRALHCTVASPARGANAASGCSRALPPAGLRVPLAQLCARSRSSCSRRWRTWTGWR
mgnify:CR=1 FL=1